MVVWEFDVIDFSYICLIGWLLIISDVDDVIFEFIEFYQWFFIVCDLKFLFCFFCLIGNVVCVDDEILVMEEVVQ